MFATRSECATRWRYLRRGHPAWNAAQLVWGGSDVGYGPNQALCVRVLRVAEQFLHRCFLDNLTRVHDGYSVGDGCDDREVVGDQEHCHLALALPVSQIFENLRLDRHVERCGGFVSD